MSMLAHVHRFILPAAYALLPHAMASPEASLLLLAIAVQESGCRCRRQWSGPAHGIYQFEAGGGVAGVIVHHASAPIIAHVLAALLYPVRVDAAYTAIEHNDVLATCFARCLLWTDPAPLPAVGNVDDAWGTYVRNWRPGNPHWNTWAASYAKARALVEL